MSGLRQIKSRHPTKWATGFGLTFTKNYSQSSDLSGLLDLMVKDGRWISGIRINGSLVIYAISLFPDLQEQKKSSHVKQEDYQEG